MMQQILELQLGLEPIGPGTMEVKQNQVPALISHQPPIQPAANKREKK